MHQLQKKVFVYSFNILSVYSLMFKIALYISCTVEYTLSMDYENPTSGYLLKMNEHLGSHKNVHIYVSNNINCQYKILKSSLKPFIT